MSPKRVLFIQHGETDKPGLVAEVACASGIGLDVLRSDLGEVVPDSLGGYSGLVLGGGEQSAYQLDRYAYLEKEIALIRTAEAAQRPVLGLCLGGQLMAAAFGGRVRQAAEKEIGFLPITLEPLAEFDPVWQRLPKMLVTTHWHGDIFEIPPGGMRLASSELTPNQLFRYGPANYGLQFHLEMTPSVLCEMVAASREDLRKLGVDPEGIEAAAPDVLEELRNHAVSVFTRWFELL